MNVTTLTGVRILFVETCTNLVAKDGDVRVSDRREKVQHGARLQHLVVPGCFWYTRFCERGAGDVSSTYGLCIDANAREVWEMRARIRPPGASKGASGGWKGKSRVKVVGSRTSRCRTVVAL